MRIVSLLPSTTEIVHALGLGEYLVGRSHECDYPNGVTQLPSCTKPKTDLGDSSREIDHQIETLLQDGLSVYRVDAEKLAELDPDLIITQDHCEACAASLPEVQQAVAEYLDQKVKILSVSPGNLEEVFDSILEIARVLEVTEKGDALVRNMKRQFSRISDMAEDLPTPELLCIEWLDPLMSAGNWVPELVQIAGGHALLSTPGEHSPVIGWEPVQQAAPDVILIMPCGYSIEQTLGEVQALNSRPEWRALNAVQHNRVYIADGHHYFNRPGPRLTDSARILAETIHPDQFEPQYQGRGWIRLTAEITK